MNRLTIFTPATGTTRVIEANELSLLAFLSQSGGHTLVLGRVALCTEEVASTPCAAPSVERVQRSANVDSPRPTPRLESGPAPSSTTEETL